MNGQLMSPLALVARMQEFTCLHMFDLMWFMGCAVMVDE
jgi:hypothetical protein